MFHISKITVQNIKTEREFQTVLKSLNREREGKSYIKRESEGEQRVRESERETKKECERETEKECEREGEWKGTLPSPLLFALGESERESERMRER